MKRLGFLAVMFGFSLAYTVTSSAAPILELPNSSDPKRHIIELVSSNVFDGEFYVWTYKVTSGQGPTVKAISHIMFDICLDYFDHAADEGGDDIELKTDSADPTLGMFGVKFDDEYADGEMRIIKFFLTKAVEKTLVDVGIKSGQNLYYGQIDGPSCECEEEEIPEPATMALIGAGIVGLTARRRRFI